MRHHGPSQADFAELKGAVSNLTTTIGAFIADHENRMRRVERWVSAIPIMALAALGTAAAAIVTAIHH